MLFYCVQISLPKPPREKSWKVISSFLSDRSLIWWFTNTISIGWIFLTIVSETPYRAANKILWIECSQIPVSWTDDKFISLEIKRHCSRINGGLNFFDECTTMKFVLYHTSTMQCSLSYTYSELACMVWDNINSNRLIMYDNCLHVLVIRFLYALYSSLTVNAYISLKIPFSLVL